MAKSKSKHRAKDIQPISLQDDHSPKDYAHKLEAKYYMKEEHKRGKEPQFRDGILKTVGEDGKRTEVPRTRILEFNKAQKIEIISAKRRLPASTEENMENLMLKPMKKMELTFKTIRNKKNQPKKDVPARHKRSQPEIEEEGEIIDSSDEASSTESEPEENDEVLEEARAVSEHLQTYQHEKQDTLTDRRTTDPITIDEARPGPSHYQNTHQKEDDINVTQQRDKGNHQVLPIGKNIDNSRSKVD